MIRLGNLAVSVAFFAAWPAFLLAQALDLRLHCVFAAALIILARLYSPGVSDPNFLVAERAYAKRPVGFNRKTPGPLSRVSSQNWESPGKDEWLKTVTISAQIPTHNHHSCEA